VTYDVTVITELLINAGVAVKTVLILLLAAGAGAVLARQKILHKQAVRDISQLIFRLTLPCLLFSSIVRELSFDTLRAAWIVPAFAVFLNTTGIVAGYLISSILRPKAPFRRSMIAATAFANSGYAPLAVFAALAMQHPELFGENVDTEGTSLVSIYLVTYSPMLWMIGFRLVSQKSLKEVTLKQLLPPPVMAALLAMVLALIPWAKSLFVGDTAVLGGVYSAAQLLGKMTMPAALIIIGANLAHGPMRNAIKIRTIVGASIGRYLIVPIVALTVLLTLQSMGMVLPRLVFFLLMLQSFVPPALNLVVMCQVQEKNQEEMASLMFWMYMIGVPLLAAWMSITILLL
jgi:predicted permease